MKRITLILMLLAAGSRMGFAQCDKKIIITTSKTEHLDANGIVQRTVDEKAVVEINKSALTINVNDEHKMTGTIKADTCNWKIPFKERKTIIKATISDESGNDKNVTITIQGMDGKVTLLFETEGEPDDRIRVAADKFGEEG